MTGIELGAACMPACMLGVSLVAMWLSSQMEKRALTKLHEAAVAYRDAAHELEEAHRTLRLALDLRLDLQETQQRRSELGEQERP